MNYISIIMKQLEARLDDCPDELLRLYALLVLATGTATSLEDVHNAWAVCRNTDNPGHPSLVPFSQLSPEVQELDDPYVTAIRIVASGLGVQP